MATRSFQHGLLAKCEAMLSRAVETLHANDAKEARSQLLEASAARFGGFNYSEFCKAFDVTPVTYLNLLLDLAEPIAEQIEKSAISFRSASCSR